MMDARRLSFVTEVTRGELRNARPQDIVTGVATDSRKLNRGELFVECGAMGDCAEYFGWSAAV